MKKQTLFAAVALAGSLQLVSAADITGTIILKGDVPKERDIPIAEPMCSALHKTAPLTTHFYMVGGKGELADVVVVLKDAEGKDITGKSTGASAKPILIDQKACEYVPTISAVQTGQKIMIKNSDAFLHNVHLTPADPGPNAAKQDNQAMPDNATPDLTFSVDKPENFMRFKCDVHNWMFTYVTVVDNPYFAVTGKDGSFKIANVPPGKYKLVAMHRKASPTGESKDIEVKDGNVTADFSLNAPK